MIPKIIHHCWLGGGKKSDLLNFCEDSWKKNLPDYEIIEWNEQNFPHHGTKFYKDALERRRYAFASDYVRAVVLREYGGIYVDADVEVRKSFDPYLQHKAFTGFEIRGLPFTAVWGSEPHHQLAEIVCAYYENLGEYTEKTNTEIVSKIISEQFGIDEKLDRKQSGNNGLTVYPSSTFCVDLEDSVAVHHFNGSWLSKKRGISVKNAVSIAYHANKLAELNGFNNRHTYDAIRRSIGLGRHILSVASRPLRDFLG